MALLVLSNPLPSAPFAEALRRVVPDVPVWTEADEPPAAEVQAILAWRMKPGILPRYPNLRVLCSTGAGVDKLLVDDLPDRVPVTRVVDPAQGVEIAQYVVAQTLAFTRDLPLYARQQVASRWQRHPVRLASQCRVGILGLGAVGQAIARAFAPLGYPVAGWSRSAKALPGIHCHAGPSDFARFLSHTDILVCALPLTPETRGLLNRETLGLLPRGAFVINVGRGEQLVERDLMAQLDHDHLAGAALDVFEREPPPPDNWVWQHPKVVATPHIAAQASFDVVAQQCVDSWRSAAAGDVPVLAVDRHAGY